MLAAETLVEAAGDYAEARLEPYRRRRLERFGERQTTSLADRLPEGLKKFVAARLLGSQWFTRNVVIDRWFLHSEQAVLSG